MGEEEAARRTMDSTLDSLQASSGLPPLVLLMVWPTIVHTLYAIIWVKPSLFFSASPPLRRVRYFGHLAYSKTASFYLMLPWFIGILDPALRNRSYLWRVFAMALAQPLALQ